MYHIYVFNLPGNLQILVFVVTMNWAKFFPKGNVVAVHHVSRKSFALRAIRNVRHFSHALVNNTPTCSNEKIPHSSISIHIGFSEYLIIPRNLRDRMK